MDIITSFSIDPMALTLLGIFVTVALSATGFILAAGTRRSAKMKHYGLSKFMTILTVLATLSLFVVSLAWTISRIPLARHEAIHQVQEQVEEVYGIQMPDGAAYRLVPRSLDSYIMANKDDSTLITRYGIAEWNQDGDVTAVQLAWNGDEWVLVESGDGQLVELERAD